MHTSINLMLAAQHVAELRHAADVERRTRGDRDGHGAQRRLARRWRRAVRPPVHRTIDWAVWV